MSVYKYLTITLFKSAKHKQDKCKETRIELARFKRNERLGRRLVRGLG